MPTDWVSRRARETPRWPAYPFSHCKIVLEKSCKIPTQTRGCPEQITTTSFQEFPSYCRIVGVGQKALSNPTFNLELVGAWDPPCGKGPSSPFDSSSSPPFLLSSGTLDGSEPCLVVSRAHQPVVASLGCEASAFNVVLSQALPYFRREQRQSLR